MEGVQLHLPYKTKYYDQRSKRKYVRLCKSYLESN